MPLIKKRSDMRGFTLVEALLVLAIISLMGAVVLASTSVMKGRARDAQRVLSLDQIANAIALYETDSGGIPPGEEGVEYVNGNPEWIPGLVPKYIHAVPSDPVDTGDHKFHYIRQGSNYEVIAFLEQHINDTSCGDGGPGGCQYLEKATGEFLAIANPGASGWRFASSTAVVTLPPPSATTTPPTATTTPPTAVVPACGNTSNDPASPVAVAGSVSGSPTVTTNAATCIDADSAAFNGAVLANDASVTGFFRYSQVRPSACTNTFGIRYPSSSGAVLAGSFMATPYTFTVNTLLPQTTYHYCAGAQNSRGTTYGASSSFTTTASTTAAAGSSISVSVGTPPANGTVLAGAYSVPFTNVTISNNSDTASYLYEFTIRQTGTAPDQALKRVLVQTLLPTTQTAASLYAVASPRIWKLGGRPTYVYSFRLTPGESKTFTIQGEIADDISAYVGQTVGLELIGLNASRPLVGSFPVIGATYTLADSSALDTTLPTVSITSPTNGTTTAGTISVTANSSDNVGVTSVQFLLDGANLGSEDTSSPFSISWNTGSTTNGTHTLSARARDAAGNTATSSTISVSVSNVSPSTLAGTTWTSRTSAVDNYWRSVTYGNGLFVAVASCCGTGNRVMTSPDGITWTSRTSAANNYWYSVTYANGLFVAVAYSGSGNRVMTSPDGITWTIRTSAADNEWRAVTYGNGLFVAVAETGTGNRVMTSPDGITWTSRTSVADNYWKSVTYANGLFVAVAASGSGNRVMTSPDGITWTSRTSAADNHWYSVTYGNGLFVAVASCCGTGNRVMTSPDGITWTSRTSVVDNQWIGVTYANGLFVAVANNGTGNRVMTSPDGITWTSRTSAADNEWNSVTYANGLFVAVSASGSGNRVMTSP